MQPSLRILMLYFGRNLARKEIEDEINKLTGELEIQR